MLPLFVRQGNLHFVCVFKPTVIPDDFVGIYTLENKRKCLMIFLGLNYDPSSNCGNYNEEQCRREDEWSSLSPFLFSAV